MAPVRDRFWAPSIPTNLKAICCVLQALLQKRDEQNGHCNGPPQKQRALTSLYVSILAPDCSNQSPWLDILEGTSFHVLPKAVSRLLSKSGFALFSHLKGSANTNPTATGAPSFASGFQLWFPVLTMRLSLSPGPSNSLAKPAGSCASLLSILHIRDAGQDRCAG